MKHDVFISHAHKDRSIADAICGKLESAGLKCWSAARDISGREDWTEATQKAIGSTRMIVLVLSENANAAPHIQKEIAHAFYLRRIIIPFRLAGALPRREILFYLGDIPWLDAPNPPTEAHLDALTARIEGLMPGSASAVTPPQSERKKTASLSPADSWFGALEASHYRTIGILKWVAITTFLCAVALFGWFALRQTKESESLAENHRQSAEPGSSLSPTPLPQVGGDVLESKQTPTFTRFGLWQAASSPSPLVQGRQEPTLNAPAEPSANVASSPQRDVTLEEPAGGLVSEHHSRHLAPVTHRVSHEHHQQYPGTQVKEWRKIADLENRRDSLQSQLKDAEEKVLAIQKRAELVTRQRDELQTRLNESEERMQILQNKADTASRQIDELRNQLKETESRALTAERNEELVRTQRDALTARLQETEGAAQTAQENADLASRQRDALQSEMVNLRERVERAETNANLEASQRDAMEAQLKKKEEEEAQDKKAQLKQRSSALAELPASAPDTQFLEVRQDAQPAHEDAEFAQTLPPNPGQNAEPAVFTESLDSSLKPAGPSGN